MCTSPHSMTEELKMYLPSVGSFLAGLFSFPLLQPQIRHSYFLPSSENRVLFLHLNGIHVFFFFFFLLLHFLRPLDSGTISASRIIFFKHKLQWVCEEVVVFYTFFLQPDYFQILYLSAGHSGLWEALGQNKRCQAQAN